MNEIYFHDNSQIIIAYRMIMDTISAKVQHIIKLNMLVKCINGLNLISYSTEEKLCMINVNFSLTIWRIFTYM